MSGSAAGGFEDVVFGAAAAMALWGFVVVVASGAFGAEVVPHSTGGAMGITFGCAGVGALLGAGSAARRRGR